MSHRKPQPGDVTPADAPPVCVDAAGNGWHRHHWLLPGSGTADTGRAWRCLRCGTERPSPEPTPYAYGRAFVGRVPRAGAGGVRR